MLGCRKKTIKKVEQKANILYNSSTTNKRRLLAMLNTDIVSNFLGLRNVIFTDFSENDNFIDIYVSTEKSNHVCPCCGNTTSRIHDYRQQIVKHSFFREKLVRLILKKRRYFCPHCGKKFFEHYHFLPRYYRCSNTLICNILTQLKLKISFKDIAAKNGVSTNVVYRLLNLLSFSDKPQLPVVLGIDEFKGNTGGEKYNLILTDLANGKIVDILPSRKKADIISYFRRYTAEERSKVKVFVMDMTNNYKGISYLFPCAEIVVDKYHYVRQVYFALDAVRKRVQKQFPDNKRLHFKHNKNILWQDYAKLSCDNQIVLRNMLNQNEDLYFAWRMKEWFIEIKKLKNLEHARRELHNWILAAEESNMPEFQACITAFHNWYGYILNGYKHNVTNGFTEGMNNNIKVLKRIAYGFRNFHTFRKRIFLCFT